MENNLTYHTSVFKFFPEFLPYLIISSVGYLGITYLIDNRTRILVKKIFSEIKTVKF